MPAPRRSRAPRRAGSRLHDGGVIHGLLLAAGGGSRMGQPKALVRTEHDEPWLTRTLDVLLAGGCGAVTVVLGAAAEEAERLLGTGKDRDDRVTVLRTPDWEAGMSMSLRAGLVALAGTESNAALVHLVDLPDVTAAVVRRVADEGDDPGGLARATYEGRPGHPVLIGRDHWAGVLADALGDAGARGYLARNHAAGIECGDLATGRDVDRR